MRRYYYFRAEYSLYAASHMTEIWFYTIQIIFVSISESLNSLWKVWADRKVKRKLCLNNLADLQKEIEIQQNSVATVCVPSAPTVLLHINIVFPLVFLIGYIAAASLHFLPSASWPIKFITYTRSNNEVHSAYSHGGASLFKEETFHMRICLSKLVVTMQWLFKALHTQRWKMDVDPRRTFQHAVVHSAWMFLWKEMFKGILICHIKAETPLGTILPPVPNFLSPLHTVVPHQLRFMWFLPFYCWPNPPVYPPAVRGSLLQHRRNNQRRAGDILNPLSQTHDAMLQQFTPSPT